MNDTQLQLELDQAKESTAPSPADGPALRVPGLSIRRGFLSVAEEPELLDLIDRQSWRTDMSRRVQHYGWRYDYKSRRVTRDSYLGPLPPWLTGLAARLAVAFRCPVADQVIVNEYLPGQGIAPHTDCAPCFGPTIGMLGLGSSVQMDFSGPAGETVPLLFGRRSAVMLQGSARYEWEHGIAKRKRDRSYDITRDRRVSLTFRTVRSA